MQPSIHYRFLGGLTVLLLVISFLTLGFDVSAQKADDPNPPDHIIKLIFIHHSTGENWLRDDYGGLGQALANNNYFVSDINYGWGPDSIGDRTDIPNWTDWFSSNETPVYMNAVFNENGQNSSYTRLPNDPVGENQIILFKSCFPNSALEGTPNDLPSVDGWLTVGHAKYVYNEILQYFGAHPEKLFVVITAPPLSDPTYAENARAFNQWLVNDWLDENNYTLPNVAVFDFYNILTASDAHHRYNGGIIEHSYGTSNTLAYPSGDDHPSEAGNRKATEEFLPLLNIFYHRWQAGSTQLPPVEVPEETLLLTETPAEAATPENGGVGVPLPPEILLSIDDFEAGSNGWTAYWDEATSSTISCVAEQGTGRNDSVSLRIDFSVTPGSWATCALTFDTPQDWSAGEWLAFDIHSEESGQPFNMIVYGGTPDIKETYIHKRETPVDYPEGYIQFMSMWKDLLRADWEDMAGSPFTQAGQVAGLAFGFDAGPEDFYTSSVRIDNIRLEKSPTYTGSGNPLNNGLPCLGSILFPLAVIGVAWVLRRK